MVGSAVQCSAVQCSAVQCSAVHCTALPVHLEPVHQGLCLAEGGEVPLRQSRLQHGGVGHQAGLRHYRGQVEGRPGPEGRDYKEDEKDKRPLVKGKSNSILARIQ
jgi:hypothetical protein